MVEELNEILQQWHPQGGGDLQLLVPKSGSTWRSLPIVTMENSHGCRGFVLPNPHLQRRFLAPSSFLQEEEKASFLPRAQTSGSGIGNGGQALTH